MNSMKVMDFVYYLYMCAWNIIHKDVQFNMQQLLLLTYETRPYQTHGCN
jgi:hypothetical protein